MTPALAATVARLVAAGKLPPGDYADPDPPCPHRGPVAEAAACGCAARAVHWCLSPAADAPDRCTLGASADQAAVRTCTPACPFR